MLKKKNFLSTKYKFHEHEIYISKSKRFLPHNEHWKTTIQAISQIQSKIAK